ncbi:hypothetical protein [[Clostridium] colinum]|uniref:hypothetical protein n=1 Tax=[Clostridium] colinum TaxID=36835 RepID=UPI002024C011|nr:hypothetical protein [[Clostridium] colinum]
MKKSLKAIFLTTLILTTSSTLTFAGSNYHLRGLGGIGSFGSSSIMGSGSRRPVTGGIGSVSSSIMGGGSRRPVTGGIGSVSSGSTTRIPNYVSDSISVEHRSTEIQTKNVILNPNSTINIVMPFDKNKLVQGTITIIGNNTKKKKEYTFANYTDNKETINIIDFNEPCIVSIRVEGRGTSKNSRIIEYKIS